MLIKLMSVAGFGAVALLMSSATCSAAPAAGIDNTNCVEGYRNFSCITSWRRRPINPHIRRVPQSGSEEETLVNRQRDERWQARCRPVVTQDQYGVSRYRYAARGCDFGTLD